MAAGKDGEKTAQGAEGIPEKPIKKRTVRKKADIAAPNGKDAVGENSAQLTQDDVIRHYLEVYQRCIQEEPKTFDAKGALSALDQISKLLGLDAPIKAADVEGNRVILTLGDKVGERGD